MANITIPDDVAIVVLDELKGAVELWAIEQIRPQITPEMSSNMIQDLKSRLIEAAGFSVIDSGGRDLLEQSAVPDVPTNQEQ